MGHATSSFYSIECPAAGATLGSGSVNADGINIGTNDNLNTGYGSLWYVLPTSSTFTSQPGQFRVVQYLSTTETPGPNWVLICASFTDAGQQVIRWQAGSVVLPIPDAGHQIQWGSNVQQLGRGVNKIVLDGSTGNITAPGDCLAGSAITQQYGRLGHNVNHAVIFRGLANSGVGSSYNITAGVGTTFIEFGGAWYFREVNAAANNLLFEINTTSVLYRNVALQRIPYVSCRVSGSIVSNSRGQITPTSTASSGAITVVMSPAHPAGADFTPQVSLISNRGDIYIDPPISGGAFTIYTFNTAGTQTNLDFYLTIL
jgi:hypothetical protein